MRIFIVLEIYLITMTNLNKLILNKDVIAGLRMNARSFKNNGKISLKPIAVL